MKEFEKTKTLAELFVAMSDKECDALAEMRKLIEEKNFHCETLKYALEMNENITSEGQYEFLSKLRIIARDLKDGNVYIHSAKVYSDGHIHYSISDKSFNNKMEVVVYGDICTIRDEHDFASLQGEAMECFRTKIRRQECIYYEHTKQ